MVLILPISTPFKYFYGSCLCSYRANCVALENGPLGRMLAEFDLYGQVARETFNSFEANVCLC